MKIEKRKKTKGLTISIIILVLLVSVGAMGLIVYLIHKNSSELLEPATTKTSHSSDKEQAQALKENPDKKQTSLNSDKPPTPTSDPGTNKQQVQMVASYSISSNTLYIRGGINYPVSDGNCYAILTGPSGQSIRKDTVLLQNPASTDCKTISVSLTDLTSGKWTFTLNYTSDNYEGVSSENSFSI